MITIQFQKHGLGTLAAFALMALAGCASHGPVSTLPAAQGAPYDEFVSSDDFREAADLAKAHLEQARIDHGLPSLSAAVSVDGMVVWAGVSGWADIDEMKPAKVDTQYRIGSTSKAVTATALARLIDTEKMELDKPISTWMEKLPKAAWGPLTPRQLASHTAGIVNYEQNRDIPGLLQSISEKKQYDAVADALSVFDGNGLKYEPGTKFEYSSFDVVLLSAAMAAAAEKPFLTVLDHQVFKPLGSSSMSADFQDRDVPKRATFYHSKGGKLRRWRDVNHSYKWAAGGLISSSSDLVRLGGAWFDEGYISEETQETFWTPQLVANGEVNEQGYAIGWRSNSQTSLHGPEKPTYNVHHGGISKGSFSWLVLYPDYKLAVALNTNARLEEFSDFIALEYPITRAFIDAAELND